MNLVNQADWDAFKNLISVDAQDTFFQQTIIWRRKLTRVDRYAEDNTQAVMQDINLKCVLNYNYMRTWPITKVTEAGETDEQSIQILFTKQHLRDGGYLNADDFFIYDPAADRFIIDGFVMKPMGDSSVSQAQDGSLLISVIVVRQTGVTGKIR